MKQNRSHLIPTTITNKNGVQTTVHKKPALSGTSSTRFPKPIVTAPSKTREQLENDVILALEPDSSENPAVAAIIEYKRTHLLGIFAQYHDETLQRITQVNRNLAVELGRLIRNKQPDEEQVNDWIVTNKTLSNEGMAAELIVNGFHNYPRLEPQRNGHYPLLRTQQVHAITRVTEHLQTLDDRSNYKTTYENSKPIRIIANEALRELLTTHENPTVIADIITTRNLTDADQITALYDTMSSTQNAVSSGIL